MTAAEEVIELREKNGLRQELGSLQKQVIDGQRQNMALLKEQVSWQQQRIVLLEEQRDVQQQMSVLSERVETLQERQAKDSHNSHLPSSSE